MLTSETQVTISIDEALKELEQLDPSVPMLALGQTVFWDEPMKAGIAKSLRSMHSSRRFVAGVHDTDYFAKHPSGVRHPGEFAILPHNDTTTRGLWSAAGEFSTLFGSETVVSRDALLASGLRLRTLSRTRPRILDEATEAWGWRGVVALDEHAPITAQVTAKHAYPRLKEAFDWAVDATLQRISEPDRIVADDRAKRLREVVGVPRDGESLGQYYLRILPGLYRLLGAEPSDIETSATTELLKFNLSTCDQPRFQLLRFFLDPETRDLAIRSYNEAIRGSEIYGLDRFGSGALPFDVVVPGRGRGTLRVGRKGLVIMTPQPLFATLSRPVLGLADLAQVIERKFGKDCTIIGKAVTLIGMLAREFIFVFHDGASNYVRYSRRFHQMLREAGCDIEAHPILRVRYHTWDALRACSTFLSLPEPLVRPFGSEELCAPSFAARWMQVAKEQEQLLANLGQLKRPTELIRFFDENIGGFWNCLNREYDHLHSRLERLDADIEDLKRQRHEKYRLRRLLRQERVGAEVAKGRHFRERIFEKNSSDEDFRARADHTKRVEDAIHAITQNEHEIRVLLNRQSELVKEPEIQAIHERRRGIELEAELKRLRLIQHATIASRGLEKSALRPGAWWFPLVSPDGRWFDETMRTAECYLEPLI